MQLLIAGDLVPTKSNYELFKDGDLKSLLGESLLSVWEASDYRIFNLEVPITDIKSPIPKCEPNLIASTKIIKGIKELNPSLITLANNHIFDQGVQGVESTKNILEGYNIKYTGIGSNIKEAKKPYIIRDNNISIGVYACAEHEFSIATESKCGANSFDFLNTFDDIQDLKKYCDYIIVLYHGGKEHYRYPSPYLQKVCKKMVEKGADLVVCQHSHCIGCYEEYLNSTIVYGQGNFIFDECDNDYWATSLLISLEISNNIKINYIPIVKKCNCIRLALENMANEILFDFKGRSSNILKEKFVEQEYEKFAKKNIENYLMNFSGIGKWMSRVDRYLFSGKLIKKRFSKEKLLAVQNFIECEAHRELFIKGLKNVIK